MRIFRISFLLFFLISQSGFSQDDLLSTLNQDEKPTIDYTTATFKSTHVVIGQSIENPPKGDLLFIITHHFGALNSGYDNLLGLKQATIRLGFDYGLTDWMGFGFGLNTLKNTWDGSVKVKAFRQSTGAKRMPFTLTLFASTATYTTKWEVPDRKNYFTSRMSYAFQVLLARKFGSRLSLQVMPTMIHRNLVTAANDKNDVYAIGGGGRFKITKRLSINGEYYYLLPNRIKSTPAYSAFSAGIDIDTGGHIFQIFLTNSPGENEESIVTQTTGTWGKGDIFLGFNITRIFTVVKPKGFKESH